SDPCVMDWQHPLCGCVIAHRSLHASSRYVGTFANSIRQGRMARCIAQKGICTPCDVFIGMIASLLEICLIGAMELRVEGTALPPSPLRKARWLLALLALRAGRSVDRDWLAALLWPDHDPSTARRNLRQLLSNNLRPYLGAASSLLVAPTPDTLRLERERAWV